MGMTKLILLVNLSMLHSLLCFCKNWKPLKSLKWQPQKLLQIQNACLLALWHLKSVEMQNLFCFFGFSGPYQHF
ncbi:hypothetical protein CISIN_1g039875mg [Citrus sinensis]|uniref:Uncharacterized protein n=1 Tax=Citrus sinensis TaxID=2711 RepID=A0A067G6D9_CITSI|nr:hypothetical protein CISIN_1g039875mg [Citrus sinensis]